MKKTILEALKTRFEGVSENILGRMADKLAKTITDESKVEEEVGKVTFQQILDSYGDFRATDASKTAVSNYEKKHSLKDGKPVTKPKDEPKEDDDGDTDTPAWAKKLIKDNEELRAKIDGFERGKVGETRKKKFADVINELPENLRKGYERIPVEGMSDEDYDKLLEEVKEEVKGIAADTSRKSAAFTRPLGNGGKQTTETGETASKEELDAVASKLKI